MAGPGICVLCLADTCTSEVHPVFLTCICLWQISQIQTFLFRVVGPGLVSTSPALMSNSELDQLNTWLKSNKSPLNVTNTHYMALHCARRKVSHNKLFINNSVVTHVSNS